MLLGYMSIVIFALKETTDILQASQRFPKPSSMCLGKLDHGVA